LGRIRPLETRSRRLVAVHTRCQLTETLAANAPCGPEPDGHNRFRLALTVFDSGSKPTLPP
jgi:hypothetical protein